MAILAVVTQGCATVHLLEGNDHRPVDAVAAAGSNGHYVVAGFHRDGELLSGWCTSHAHARTGGWIVTGSYGVGFTGRCEESWADPRSLGREAALYDHLVHHNLWGHGQEAWNEVVERHRSALGHSVGRIDDEPIAGDDPDVRLAWHDDDEVALVDPQGRELAHFEVGPRRLPMASGARRLGTLLAVLPCLAFDVATLPALIAWKLGLQLVRLSPTMAAATDALD